MIDLSLLPAPQIVESLDFETIMSELKSGYLTLIPAEERDAWAETLNLDSEPIAKLLQISAYRELILRQRINDAARAVMLAFATGPDLDQLGANYNIARLEFSQGRKESDSDFRTRIQMSFDGYTTAGSGGSYRFHAKSAHAEIKDVRCVSPDDGEVVVYVLSRIGNGFPTSALLSAVENSLTAETVRPLTDHVTVMPTTIINYTVSATLHIPHGPDREVVRSQAISALGRLTSEQHKIGARVSVSSIFAALQQPGVSHVALAAPLTDIVTTESEAPYCSGFLISLQVYA